MLRDAPVTVVVDAVAVFALGTVEDAVAVVIAAVQTLVDEPIAVVVEAVADLEREVDGDHPERAAARVRWLRLRVQRAQPGEQLVAVAPAVAVGVGALRIRSQLDLLPVEERVVVAVRVLRVRPDRRLDGVLQPVEVGVEVRRWRQHGRRERDLGDRRDPAAVVRPRAGL